MKKNRIDYVWLISGNEGFGISRATISLINQMRTDGKHIVFISLTKVNFHDLLIASGYEVHSLNTCLPAFFKNNIWYFLLNIFRNILFAIKTTYQIKKVLKFIAPNFFIFSTPGLFFITALLPSSNFYKLWLMPNTISSNYFLNLNKRLYQIFSKLGSIHLIANSYFTASTIKGWGINPHVLHLGVDEQKFNSTLLEKKRSDFNLKQKDIVFGIFARIDYTKAQDVIIEALQKIKNKYPEISFKLLLIGVDNQEDSFFLKCKGLVNKADMNNEVVFYDKVSDIENYYNLVDIIINSRRDAEPFGLTIIEAMLMKKPVIAFGLGGPSETIIDGQTGWLVDEPSVDYYYDAMNKAIESKSEWIAMGIKSRERAIANFTSEKFYSNFLKILHQIE